MTNNNYYNENLKTMAQKYALKDPYHFLEDTKTQEKIKEKIVEKQKKQDRFLQQYPKAKLFDLSDFTGENIFCLSICPLDVDCFLSKDRCKYSCIDCKKNYWLSEVDENE